MFGFSNDATTWLLVVLSLATTVNITVLAAYHITYRRLESKCERATTTREVLLPIVKQREAAQDPEGHHGIISEVLAESITW